MKNTLIFGIFVITIFSCKSSKMEQKINISKYKELISQGVEVYIEELKPILPIENLGTFNRDLSGRERKEELFRKYFSNYPESIYLCFADIKYSTDFYEDFQEKISDIIKITFDANLTQDYNITLKDYNFEYSIVIQYKNGSTKETLGETIFLSDNSRMVEEQSKKNQEQYNQILDKIGNNVFHEICIISVAVENQKYVYDWHMHFQDNAMQGFLSFLNKIAKFKGFQNRWFALSSYYTENYIYISPEKYNLILSKGLIPEEGYNYHEDKIFFPKGIISHL